jgi:hypothetical protein
MRATSLLLFLLDIALTLMQLSCYTKASYHPLGQVTEVVVNDQNQILKKITDPVKIAEVIKFVNDHRHGWYTPIQDVPVPKITLRFYNHTQYKGAFGVGSNFFYSQRDGRFDAKSATVEEIQSFLNLIEVDKRRLSRKFGEIDPSLPPPK